VVLCLGIFYFYFNKADVIYFDALLSLLVVIVYITAYIYFSADFPLYLKRAGVICELLPALSDCFLYRLFLFRVISDMIISHSKSRELRFVWINCLARTRCLTRSRHHVTDCLYTGPHYKSE